MKTKMMLLTAAVMSFGSFAIAMEPKAASDAPVVLASDSGMEMPPAGYQGQWWTNQLGCTYSRTGRPGEVSWTLHRHTMKRGCPNYFVQVPMGG